MCRAPQHKHAIGRFHLTLLRHATSTDLKVVRSWITTARDCELWAGWRVRFPIELESLQAAISFTETNTFSLVDGDHLIAFGQLVQKDTNRGHLARLIVAPSFRGKGYGEALVRALLEEARAASYGPVSLNVDRSNLAAIALYSKLGFRDVM